MASPGTTDSSKLTPTKRKRESEAAAVTAGTEERELNEIDLTEEPEEEVD